MRRIVTGEQVARLSNPDPFALPVWRAPVYRTPAGIVIIAQLARLLGRLIRLTARHPFAASILALVAVIWLKLGWVVLVALAAAVITILVAWRWFWPVSFARWVTRPARGAWRGWRYRRRWAGVMTIAGAAPWYQGRVILPVLGKVTATRYTDRVQVRAGLGPVRRRLRQLRGEPGRRVRGNAVPGPLGQVRPGGAGVRPPRRLGRHHPSHAHSRQPGPQGAAGWSP